MFSTETFNDDMSNIISIAQEYYAKQEQDRVFSNAVDKAFKSCGAENGEILTKEHIDKINSIILKEIEPYIIHSLRKK
jgi:C-terminal processing protease CtpA/Prc